MAKSKEKQKKKSIGGMIGKIIGSLAFFAAALAVLPKVTEKISNILYYNIRSINRLYKGMGGDVKWKKPDRKEQK